MPIEFGPLLLGDPSNAELKDLDVLLGKYFLSKDGQAYLMIADGLERVPILPLHQDPERLKAWATLRQAPYNKLGQVVNPLHFLKTLMEGILKNTPFKHFLLMLNPVAEAGGDRFSMILIEPDTLKAFEEDRKLN
jgi:hypothetical protein